MCLSPPEDGPGANQDLFTGLVDFIGSTLLTWLAFVLLPTSVRSAGMREVTSATMIQENNREKGGRLQGLLGYDVVCFLLSTALCGFLTYVDASHLRPGGLPQQPAGWAEMQGDADTWEGHTAIFWARVFYAFLSFPFVVFLIPGLNSVLTHTTATGFNRNGLCVPFMLHPMPADKDK